MQDAAKLVAWEAWMEVVEALRRLWGSERQSFPSNPPYDTFGSGADFGTALNTSPTQRRHSSESAESVEPSCDFSSRQQDCGDRVRYDRHYLDSRSSYSERAHRTPRGSRRHPRAFPRPVAP